MHSFMGITIEEHDIDSFVQACNGVITARDSETQEHLGAFSDMKDLRGTYPSAEVGSATPSPDGVYVYIN